MATSTKATKRRPQTTASGHANLSVPAMAAALSTGGFLAVAHREVQLEQKAARGNQRTILRRGLARLGEARLLSKWEQDRLNRVCDLLLLIGARPEKNAHDAVGRLQAIHDEMLARNAGPLALTIAEVAANHERLSGITPGTTARASTRAGRDPALGNLAIGGIAGALAGFAAGGPVGAGIGFVAGWIGRGLMEGC